MKPGAIKITLEELNLAYTKANKYKVGGYPIRSSIDIGIERSISTMGEPLNEIGVFTTLFVLKFVADNNLGPKGSYVLSTLVDVINIDSDEN